MSADAVSSSLGALRVGDAAIPLPVKAGLTEAPPPETSAPEANLVASVGGAASCSSRFNERLGAEKAFSIGDVDGWASERLFNSNINEWVSFAFNRPVVVAAFAFKGDPDPEPLDSPTSYSLQGSHDSIEWTPVFTIEDTPPFVTPDETRFHRTASPASFPVYRLLVTQTSWSKPGNLCGSIVVRDLRMFG